MSIQAQTVDALEAILMDREGKLREATALYEHAKRELPRARARIERASQDELRAWKEGFLGGFLEVLDDVDRALAAARAPGVSPAIREGLELVAARFTAKLSAAGVEPIPEPVRFNPHLHEAVATQPAAAPEDDGAVLAVVAPGYLFEEKVLRPARVVVGVYR